MEIIGVKYVLFIIFCMYVFEMCVLLFDIWEGDEVIMLFFIFVFVVNVFVLCGVWIVFVDIDFGMMNVDFVKV